MKSNREEVEFDIKHRPVGLQRIALLPWTEDKLWIRRVTEQMTKGEFEYDDLTPDFWRRNTDVQE